MKLMAAAPLFATIGRRSLAATVANTMNPKSKRSFSDNIYTRIGVRPLINARGTWTYLCGSLELPETKQAMQEASDYFVDFFQLQAGVSRQLAKLSGAEAGMITSGAAAALASATAGCIAGTDPKNVWQLPDTTGLKNEVVMLGGRIDFDSAIRLCGAKLVVAPTVDDLKGAINSQTAMVYTIMRDDDRLTRALNITRPAGVPLLVDDAPGIPPWENFSRFIKLGVDLCVFSGGKGVCGPQCAGVLLGRKQLIDAALANTSPWEGAVCRPMKVAKEEIMGLLAALDYWSRADLVALNKEWQGKVERIAKLVETVPGVTTSIATPQVSNSYPTLTVNWDEAAFGLTVPQCTQKLLEGDPAIAVLTNNNPSSVMYPGRKPKPGPNLLRIVSMTLQPGEDLIVGNRLRQILNQARKRTA